MHVMSPESRDLRHFIRIAPPFSWIPSVCGPFSHLRCMTFLLNGHSSRVTIFSVQVSHWFSLLICLRSWFEERGSC